ncbi:phosphotransferase family protein [Amycolatopsis lurida]
MARVGRPGGVGIAEREVRVARWLAESGVPVIRPVAAVEQPVVSANRAVTWWEELPPHRAAQPDELGSLLRQLHELPVPIDLALPEFDPFAELLGNLKSVGDWLPAADRSWLEELAGQLRADLAATPAWRTPHVLHGDAWQGNVAVPEQGEPVLLDLEQVSIGDPAWDLAPLAVDYADFSRVSDEDYKAFTNAYGADVLEWTGFRTMATVCELRWTAFVLSKSDGANSAADEARHRLACLRGEIEKPWSWTAL